jgi:hypothetical protein
VLAAPAPHVEPLPYGGVTLRLSDQLSDLRSRFEEFQATRHAVKEHLNCNAFFDPRLRRDHVYTVPEVFRDPDHEARPAAADLPVT